MVQRYKIMVGKIVVPTFYKEKHEDKSGMGGRSNILLHGLSKQYNMPLYYTDTPTFEDVDFGLVYAVPYHNRPTLPPGLLDTDSRVKLIGHFEDLECWGNEECIKNKLLVFKRFDVLIGSFPETFSKWYPQFLYKYIHYPNHFAPLEKFTALEPASDPIMKCLLLGSVNKFYPFRQYIINKVSKDILHYSRPNIEFAEYPKFLNSYFCAIATGAVSSVVVAKYLEIPAAGTLLLAEEINDLVLLGLKANVHYVPITRETVVEKIRSVLKNPERYIEMRDRATKLVRENCSEINRLEEFKNILQFIKVNKKW